MERKVNKKADMNANDMYSIIAKRTGHTAKEVKTILAEFGAHIRTDVAMNGGCVLFPGIGKFVRSYRRAFTGRNPSTGEVKNIEATAIIRFIPSAALKQLAKIGSDK